MMDLHLCGDLTEPPSTGREEPAEQTAALEFLEPGLRRSAVQPTRSRTLVSSAEITALQSRNRRSV